MTTLPTPATLVANTKPTAANFNTFRDALQQLQGGTPTGGQGPLDFFTAVQDAAQTGLTISTFVSITFDASTEVVDIAGGHDTSTNNSRYTGKTPGYYEVQGCVAFAGSASGVRRLARIALNGTGIGGSRGSSPPLSTVDCVASTPTVYVYLNGTTDYVELQGFADYASWATTISTDAASRLSVRWVHS